MSNKTQTFDFRGEHKPGDLVAILKGNHHPQNTLVQWRGRVIGVNFKLAPGEAPEALTYVVLVGAADFTVDPWQVVPAASGPMAGEDFYEVGDRKLLPTGSKHGAPYYGVIIAGHRFNEVEGIWEHEVVFVDGSREWTLAEMFEFDRHEDGDVEFWAGSVEIAGHRVSLATAA